MREMRTQDSVKNYMSDKIGGGWVRLVIEIINRPDLIVLCPAVIQTGMRKPWLILGRINYRAFRLIHYRRVTTTCQKNDGISFDRTEIAVCEVRLTELRGEIELKRIAAQSTQQHGESIAQGSTILYWTKWAVAVGVVVPILVALIAEIPFSRLLPARASQASPTSSPQASATVAPSPAPTAIESPSESPQASPTPESTSTPAQTPIKFPPPAP